MVSGTINNDCTILFLLKSKTCCRAFMYELALVHTCDTLPKLFLLLEQSLPHMVDRNATSTWYRMRIAGWETGRRAAVCLRSFRKLEAVWGTTAVSTRIRYTSCCCSSYVRTWIIFFVAVARCSLKETKKLTFLEHDDDGGTICNLRYEKSNLYPYPSVDPGGIQYLSQRAPGTYVERRIRAADVHLTHLAACRRQRWGVDLQLASKLTNTYSYHTYVQAVLP